MEKSLVKNAFFNVIYKSLNVVFPFISAAYISHVLLSSGVGKVAYAQNISQYFVLLAPLGLKTYGVKQIAKNRKQWSDLNRTFNELFSINFVSTTVFTLMYYGLIFTHPYFQKDCRLFCVTGLAIVFNYINIDWFYEGIEKFDYIALRSLFIKVMSLIALLLFVKSTDDYIIYALIYVLAIGGNNLFNIIKLRDLKIKWSLEKLNIRIHLKSVFILLLNSLVLDLFSLFDTSMLGYLCSDVVVGYYSNAIKLIKVWVSLITAISGVLLPRLSFTIGDESEKESSCLISQVFTAMTYLICPSVVGMYLLSDSIILVTYGQSFAPAASTLRMGTLLIVALAYSYLFGVQVLITNNCETRLFICSLIGMIANLTLNLFLIPQYYQNGAVVASVISESLSAVATYLFAKKYITLKIKKNDVLHIIIGTCLMGMVVYGICCLELNDIEKIGGAIIAGLAIYCGYNFLFNKTLRHELIQLLH